MRMLLEIRALHGISVPFTSELLAPILQCRGCKNSAYAKLPLQIHLQLPKTDYGY